MDQEARGMRPSVTVGRHRIYTFVGDPAGPTLIAFGSIHGNEAAGAVALERVSRRLLELNPLVRGRVYLLAGNTRAILQSVRFIDADLNRHWTEANIRKNSSARELPDPLSEDTEQRELLVDIEEILSTAKDEVYALDLHSTSAEGAAFATVGDTLRNRGFARQFPITILLGIEEQLEGTLLEYLNNLGAVTLGFEGGQHFAASTIDTHEALVWSALYNSGILEDEDDRRHWYDVLNRATQHPRILEVRYRHAIDPSDGFEMHPGFNNFDTVRKGQLLAKDVRGDVRSNESGVILMPLYQKLGEDGFFLGREVAPFWLWLSAVLRRAGAHRLMPFLPGVRRSRTDPETLEIDTRVARFFPLQILHLLGFRRRRWIGSQLVVSRRKFDTISPYRSRSETCMSSN